MIERILVSLDGSLLSEQILPHVRRMLYRNDSEIILVRAVVPPLAEHSMMIAQAVLPVATEYIQRIQDQLLLKGVRVRAVSRIGSAVRTILEVADDENATMLALATHGETGLRRLLLGSVAEDLIRISPVPVFVVRPFWSYDLLPADPEKQELRPIRNILLPLQGSETVSAILSPLCEFARLFESCVVLLHVKDSWSRGKKDPAEEREEGEAILRACSRRLGEQGVETVPLLDAGGPAEAILRVARSNEIDLIAMTTRGRSGLSRLLAGSVAERVLHESTCPMLVVRSSDPTAETRRPVASRGIQK